MGKSSQARRSQSIASPRMGEFSRARPSQPATSLRVYVSGMEEESSFSSFSHSSLLPSDFDDRRVESLYDYISNGYNKGLPFIGSYQVPTRHEEALDIKELIRDEFLQEEYRGFIRTMITFLCDLHDHGQSLLQFHESNLVVHDGKLKFRGLKFIKSDLEHRRKNDFELIRGIIVNVIEKHKQDKISDDLEDLLSLMEDYSDSKQDLILNHLTILSPSERLATIWNFREKFKSISDERDKINYYTAVKKIVKRDIYLGDWTDWYIGEAAKSTGPAKECFDYKPRSNDTEQEQNYRGTNVDILRFCRNMVSHLHEHIPKHTSNSKYRVEEEVYLIIMSLFGKELLSFQKLAHQGGILKYFIPEYRTSSVAGQDPIQISAGGGGQGNPSSTQGTTSNSTTR